ncbi:MAG: cytidylyltransferase domain-containing protein [bacterium]
MNADFFKESAPLQEFVVIIQARMGSKRLPGKTFHMLKGKPTIEHLIDSIVQCVDRSRIVVATSVCSKDDVISDYCLNNDIAVFRGELGNVASRFYEIVKTLNPHYFVRLNADSPLFDYRVLALALETFQNAECDLVSTSCEKSFPSGLHVEIVKAETFLNAYQKFSTPDHFEHVTLYFYENKDSARILSLRAQIQNPGRYKFSLDTVEDRERLEKFFHSLENPHYTYTLQDKCTLFNKLFLN